MGNLDKNVMPRLGKHSGAILHSEVFEGSMYVFKDEGKQKYVLCFDLAFQVALDIPQCVGSLEESSNTLLDANLWDIVLCHTGLSVYEPLISE